MTGWMLLGAGVIAVGLAVSWPAAGIAAAAGLWTSK